MNKNRAIKNFFSFLQEIEGDYFLFGHIPEEELGFLRGKRKNKDEDPIFDWADKFFDDDQAVDVVINFFISTIAVLIKKEKFDKIDKIKEIIDLVYEKKVLN